MPEMRLNSPADRPKVGRQKRDPQKSRITNGSALLSGVDGRSPWVRRCKDVIASHLSDHPGASAAERSIIRRASVLTVENPITPPHTLKNSNRESPHDQNRHRTLLSGPKHPVINSALMPSSR